MIPVTLDKGRQVITPHHTIDEAAKYLRISRGTFFRWTTTLKVKHDGGKGKNRTYHQSTLDRMSKEIEKQENGK